LSCICGKVVGATSSEGFLITAALKKVNIYCMFDCWAYF